MAQDRTVIQSHVSHDHQTFHIPIYHSPGAQIDRCGRLVVVVDNMSVMGRCFFIPYRFCLVLLYRDSQTATFLIPERFSVAVRFRHREQNLIFTAMIQEQINFLERFEVYLANRGFRVLKSAYNVEAIDKAKLFGCIPAICRFSWQLYGYNPSVLLDIVLGSNSVQRSFYVCQLMEYRAIGRDIFEAAVRSAMSSVADEMVHQFFKNIPQ